MHIKIDYNIHKI